MQIFNTTQIGEIAALLLAGNIGVLPTDTIYGLHCLWNRKELAEKISGIKGRGDNRFIIIVPNNQDLSELGITVNDFARAQIERFWPGPNTLIFATREGGTLALRTPDNAFLQELLTQTGPLISTSANPHGGKPATTVEESRSYFGDKVDFYVDGDTLAGKASSIYKITDEVVEKLR